MKIKFRKTGLEVDCPRTEVPLIDICYENNTPINFGCRVGMCGTCRINVVSGIENISAKNEDEEFLTSSPCQRLACQCIVQGDIEIE